MKYYSLKEILKHEAHYNMIIGERSNGKTYSVLEYAITKFVKGDGQLALVRRYREDFRGKNGEAMFSALVANGVISKLTRGVWTDVYYYSSRWYLCRWEDDKRITHEKPFAYAFALSEFERDKSTSYPEVTTILFDEFITRGYYLADEFVIFCNVISTIARQRNNIKIFMLGNTVNKDAPYFKEMGLKNVAHMRQGSIDVYEYGDSGLKVAVEYCSPIEKTGKQSDVYFAFDNPKLKMITGGEWELDIYPHCPEKYRPNQIVGNFFVLYMEKILQCDFVVTEKNTFIFVHEKTTELKDPENDLIYSTEWDPRPNWRRSILRPEFPVEKKIYQLFRAEKVFYQDNEIGEIMNNYIKWCKTNSN